MVGGSKLTFIRNLDVKDRYNRDVYECLCECGNLFKVSKYNFETGRVKACGCQRGKAGTHHYTKHPMFARYKVMIARCTNPNNKSYKNYGGRGIKVCDRWAEPMPLGFENFLSDMGNCPDKFSLERLDNNGDYSPDNCIWADSKSQARNKTTNHSITINSNTKTLAEWSEYFKCSTYKVEVAYRKFGDDLNSIRQFCSSNLYMNNSTGHRNIVFDRSRGLYITRYVCYSGVKKSKRFKTLEEAVQFKKDNCYENRTAEKSN